MQKLEITFFLTNEVIAEVEEMIDDKTYGYAGQYNEEQYCSGLTTIAENIREE